MPATDVSTRLYCTDHARTVKLMGMWGIAVNLALSAVKFTFGILGTSHAMVADAAHSLSDCASDLAIIIGVRYWAAPADQKHPYGHARIETLVSFFIGLGLIAVALGIIYNATRSLHDPGPSSPDLAVAGGAVIAILVKEVLYRWTAKLGHNVDSRALLANAWHHRTDALSSVPVVIAVLGTWVWPDLLYLDQVAAVIVAVLILLGAWKITGPAMQQLTDTGLDKEETEKIRASAYNVPGVANVHALRTRRVGPGVEVDLHILVAPDMTVWEGHQVASNVERQLQEQHQRIVDVLVHLEPQQTSGNPVATS